MKKLERLELFLGPWAAVIVLLITIVLGELIGTIPWWKTALGTAIFLAVILGVVCMTLLVVQASHRDELESVVSKLKGLIPPSKFAWLKDEDDLVGLEGSVKCQHIWIVSPDLSNDTNQADIQKAVRKNIKKKVTYTYIVPDTEEIKVRECALAKMFESCPKQLKVIKIREDRFRALALRHIAMYNPEMENDIPPKVFLELPVEDEGRWIEVTDQAAYALVGRFRAIVEAENTQAQLAPAGQSAGPLGGGLERD